MRSVPAHSHSTRLRSSSRGGRRSFAFSQASARSRGRPAQPASRAASPASVAVAAAPGVALDMPSSPSSASPSTVPLASQPSAAIPSPLVSLQPLIPSSQSVSLSLAPSSIPLSSAPRQYVHERIDIGDEEDHKEANVHPDYSTTGHDSRAGDRRPSEYDLPEFEPAAVITILREIISDYQMSIDEGESALRARANAIISLSRIPLSFCDIMADSGLDYFTNVPANLLASIVKIIGGTPSKLSPVERAANANKGTIWRAVLPSHVLARGYVGVVESELSHLYSSLPSDASEDERSQLVGEVLRVCTDSCVIECIPSLERFLIVRLYQDIIPASSRTVARLSTRSDERTIEIARKELIRFLSPTSGASQPVSSRGTISVSGAEDPLSPIAPSGNTTDTQVQLLAKAVMELAARMDNQASTTAHPLDSIPAASAATARALRAPLTPTAPVTTSTDPSSRRVSFSAQPTSSRNLIAQLASATGFTNDERIRSTPLTLAPSPAAASSRPVFSASTDFGDDDREERGDSDDSDADDNAATVHSSFSASSASAATSDFFNRAVAPEMSFTKFLLENIRHYASVTQYLAQSMSEDIKNKRNLREMQRLAKLLDAMRYGKKEAFELAARIFFGIQMADGNGDYSVVDQMVGEQRSHLPIHVVTLINKSRLANQKLERRTVDEKSDTIDYFTHRSHSSINTSGGRGARGGRGGNRGGFNNRSSYHHNNSNNARPVNTGSGSGTSASGAAGK
jgi:hypothetical protein